MGHQIVLVRGLTCMRQLNPCRAIYCVAIQSYTFTDASSTTECLEVMESFVFTAVEEGYNLWSYVNFSDKDQLLESLVTSYKEIPAPAAVIKKRLDVSAPDALSVQSSMPAQPPKIDVGKIKFSGSLVFYVDIIVFAVLNGLS